MLGVAEGRRKRGKLPKSLMEARWADERPGGPPSQGQLLSEGA